MTSNTTGKHTTLRTHIVSFCVAASALVAFFPGLSAAEGSHHDHEEKPAFAAGKRGDATMSARIVEMTMTEADGRMVVASDTLQVRKGEQVRFVLRNDGLLDHGFVLGTAEQNLRHAEAMMANDMQHDGPNAKTLSPAMIREVIWKFSSAGEFEYAYSISRHREAGMLGTVVLKRA